MAEQLSSTLLDRYLAGEATSDERTRVERWVEEAPERAELLAMLRQDRVGASSPIDVDVAWQRVAARLQANATPARPVPTRAHRATRWLLPMAAALLIAASLIMWRTGLPTGGS